MKTVRATKNIAALVHNGRFWTFFIQNYLIIGHKIGKNDHCVVVQSKPTTKLKEEGAHNKKEDAQWKERASYAQWEECKY